MSNNAKFDREWVVDKATQLYWEKGFHATSMRNLQDVIDMRPGSIYAAFGSKEGLFKETLVRYTQQGIDKLQSCRKQTSSPLSALKLFMRQVVIEAQTQSPNGMCMLVKTVSELTDEQPELLQAAKDALKTMEAEFEAVIVEAQTIGEVANHKNAKALARHIQVQITGLRSYARTTDGDAPLAQMIDEVFEHHPFV
ncbi:TetR/AcrR family transcriptional regulator [Alginatibacterium sediminis]|uniref:TetR/AcrR family transcriptional regulator n=1 Tax=Alginatibacterium sediminis TaxID=2164068 RepID=A0A420E9T4_9ALTE|nr:TetR/AcrR family transcriptional regulator [Alginatibacterium sediminis]RKF17430.1 TetR/AcrR family transcriptional regulator [Alginatibacterium sediminis]